MTTSSDITDRQKVLAIIDREIKAVSIGNAAAYFAILDEEARFLPPNLEPKHGAELRTWLQDFGERFEVEWLNFVHHETETAGDFAYHRYTYSWRVTPRSGGPAAVAHGKGLHILRRRQGAEWKILCEIWNASPSPGVS
jgi:ketosteroid isomerase-like protein